MKRTMGTHVHKSTSTQERKRTSRRVFLSTCLPEYLCTCLVFVLSLTGCTQVKQLQNLEPLLTLKDFSEEKDDQAKWVEMELGKFEILNTAVSDGSIKNFTTKDAIRKQFGDPVVVDYQLDNNLTVERWLYRHPIQKLASDRLYFYFDADGRLLRFERVSPTPHA